MPSNPPLHVLPFLFLLSSYSAAKASSHGGFSIPIIRRSSPLSSLRRASSTASNSVGSTVAPNNADHIMKFSIGTPPVEVYVDVDTGSNLVWSRCKPCTDCERRRVPFFDPQRSSTFAQLPCGSPQCREFDPSACQRGPKCSYSYGYVDGSFSDGVLSTETLTFFSTDGGSTSSFPNISFGCGYNNSEGIDGSIFGVAGLGRGPTSLISQLAPSVGGKFSYCLVPFYDHTSTSVMNFGDRAVIGDPDVVSTPMVDGDDPTLYFVTLEQISIGEMTIEVSPPSGGGGRPMLLDSGTTNTYLSVDVFNQVNETLTSVVKLPPTTNSFDSTFVCYKAESRDGFPSITFHFAGGAGVVLRPFNAYFELPGEGLVCLIAQPTDGTMLFGNTVQQNFHVAYDLEKKTVSFAPAECSRLSN